MKYKEAMEYILDFVPEDEKGIEARHVIADELFRITNKKRALLAWMQHAQELDWEDEFNCGYIAAVQVFLQMRKVARNE